MVQVLIQLIIGIVGGIAAGLQSPFTAIMGGKTGELTSVFFTYVGGAIVIAAIVAASGGGQVSQWRTIPWYAFLAGPLGLVIIGSLAYTVPRVGSVGATTIFVLSWLLFSAVTDHFGWLGVPQRSLDLSRILGLVALILGTWLVIRQA